MYISKYMLNMITHLLSDYVLYLTHRHCSEVGVT